MKQVIGLCAVLVLLVALMWITRTKPRIRRRAEAATAAARVKIVRPVSLVYAIEKELVRTSDRAPRLELRDSYFARMQVEPGKAPGTYVASGGQRCETREVAERSTSEILREVLVASEAGLKLERLGEDGPALIGLPGDVPAGISIVTSGTLHGWPLLDEVGTSPEEDRQIRFRRSESLQAGPDVAKRVLFNPMPGERLSVRPADGETVEVGGRNVKCYRVVYDGDARAGTLQHRIDGAVWVAPGLGPVREERSVRIDDTMAVVDETAPKGRPHFRDVAVSIKCTVKRTLVALPL